MDPSDAVMSTPSRTAGRAAGFNPPNRYEPIQLEPDTEHDEFEQDLESVKIPTQFYRDETQSLIRQNDSPDIPFRYSINAYRGCEHGCAYCYARPGHEQLGWKAGLDFESRIMVKMSAAAILRKELCHPRWTGEPITMSGVTDCYQPVERQLRITRSLLEVLVEARQAFSIVTKNKLVTRDLDLLSQAAKWNGVHVFVSITTLQSELTRRLEPRTSVPAARLSAIAELSAAGIPTGVMLAPIIPGLNDQEIPMILKQAKQAGAQAAAKILLRLPLSVRPVFESWLQQFLPVSQQQRIIRRIQDCRNGRMNDSAFGRRMTGSGTYAAAIHQTFLTFAEKWGLSNNLVPLNTAEFRRPRSESGQKSFF